MDGINKFKFGEVVGIIDYSDKVLVRGKIKDLNCYVVSADQRSIFNKLKTLLNRFGIPNRHLELEWGKFSGFNTEFIVPHNSMIKFK